jgi:hypothetical protein
MQEELVNPQENSVVLLLIGSMIGTHSISILRVEAKAHFS